MAKDKKTPNHGVLPPILANGEEYVEPIDRRSRWGPTSYPRTYEEARALVKNQLQQVKGALRQLPPTHVLPEAVVCFRLHPDFDTKSSYPHALMRFPGLKAVGSRRWRRSVTGPDGLLEWQPAKLIFVRTSIDALDAFAEHLDLREHLLPENLKNDIRKLEAIDLLSPDESLNFPDDWSGGRIEVVIHPLGSLATVARMKLLQLLQSHKVPLDQVRIAEYEEGLAFWSILGTPSLVADLGRFNPLRTAHPLKLRGLPFIRFNTQGPAPAPPQGNAKSAITIGMFDGGIDPNNPLLKGFAVESTESVKAPADPEGVRHGTGVAGAILYGPLGDHPSNVPLPVPPVCVESFRALPVTPSDDPDLYEAINLIERVVPTRSDIAVYNLSFGPEGPIWDDHISRFTYATDRLSYIHGVVFCTAVGNDGHLPGDLSRIQAPSDHVNNIAVGAFTYDSEGRVVRAPYSCKGRGREGGKVKPDVVAFGGSVARPFGVVSTAPGKLDYVAGTSFAAPLVARRMGELLGRCDRLSPLLARALVLHTASLPEGASEVEMGYGVIADSADSTLGCAPGSVTVLYEGKLQPRRYAKLLLPVPKLEGFNGNVEIRWTIVVVAKPDPFNADEYTESSIEDTFHPHDQIYSLTKGRKTKTVHLKQDSEEISALVSEGWKLSDFPVSRSGNAYADEQTRRANYKWDTVVRRRVSMRYGSLHNPFLILHGLGRNDGDNASSRMRYAVVVTLTAKTFGGNLYEETVKQFTKLTPLRIKSANEILIRPL